MTVGDLADWSWGGRAGGLAVWLNGLDSSGRSNGSRWGSIAANHDNVNWGALAGIVLVVEVVEVSTEALVPSRIGAESELSVLADRETSGIDGTSLGWVVELELIVRGDVASAALCILKDTTRESQFEWGGLSLLLN